jgi:hypothetical protein
MQLPRRLNPHTVVSALRQAQGDMTELRSVTQAADLVILSLSKDELAEG